MNVSDKTKDNDKARRDIVLYYRRRDLELQSQTNGKLLKPKANYTLTKDEAKIVCHWIKELRMPDGYSCNLARCADTEKGSIHGMKSHDCHVFMETLLPIAFSSLPMHVLNPVIEISHFFKDLCSTILMGDSIKRLEENIPLILCKLERIFPLGFFDSMEHLPIIFHTKHGLANQCNIGGCIRLKGDMITIFCISCSCPSLMYSFSSYRFMGNQNVL